MVKLVLPLKVDIQCRMISYWSKLVCPVTNNLSTKLYFIAKTYIDGLNQNTCFKWFEEVRNILISCGYIGFWDNLNFPNKNWLLKSTKQKLTDLYFNEWNNACNNNTSWYIYKLFKTSFGFENYLTKVPFKLRKYLIQIRTRNHRLPIEKVDYL